MGVYVLVRESCGVFCLALSMLQQKKKAKRNMESTISWRVEESKKLTDWKLGNCFAPPPIQTNQFYQFIETLEALFVFINFPLMFEEDVAEDANGDTLIIYREKKRDVVGASCGGEGAI
jgi:hypothetical protein